MTRDDLERELAAAIDAESKIGIPWGFGGGARMAPIVDRRWSSFCRRHPKAKSPTSDDRILDLAKGLQAHFEPKTPYTPLSEWLHLARLLEKVFARASGAERP